MPKWTILIGKAAKAAKTPERQATPAKLCAEPGCRVEPDKPHYQFCRAHWWKGKHPVARDQRFDPDSRGIFWVYLLGLRGGNYYVGMTNNLEARLTEHKAGATKSTAGQDPRLLWIKAVPTRKEAADLEYRLQLKNQTKEGRRYLTSLVVEQKNALKLLDYVRIID